MRGLVWVVIWVLLLGLLSSWLSGVPVATMAHAASGLLAGLGA
jgi:hypothetical protein